MLLLVGTMDQNIIKNNYNSFSPTNNWLNRNWKCSRADDTPNTSLRYLNIPLEQANVVRFLDSSSSSIWWYPWFRSTLLKIVDLASAICSIASSRVGIGCRVRRIASFTFLISTYTLLYLNHTLAMVSQHGVEFPKICFNLYLLPRKKCIRVMFGDKDAYMDKFKTCARTRSFENRFLGKDFFSRRTI